MKVGRLSLADELREEVKGLPDIPLRYRLLHIADEIGLRYENEVHLQTCMAGTQGQWSHWRQVDERGPAPRTLCGKNVRFEDPGTDLADCQRCKALASERMDAVA